MSEFNPIIATLLEVDDLDDLGDMDKLDPDEVKSVLSPEIHQRLFEYLQKGIIEVRGSVGRHSHHYVHWNTTSCELEIYGFNWDQTDIHDPEEQQHIEEQLSGYVADLAVDIDKSMQSWNKKIYRELEDSHDGYTSDEAIEENIRANDYDFEEDGTRSDKAEVLLKYDDLLPKAKERARDWYRESLDQDDWQYMAEPVILEWRWLLTEKGFDGIKISWSGFSSQGDGASFTAKGINLLKYLQAPDPLEIPEQDRQQLEESEEGDIDDAKDAYAIEPDPQGPLTDIRTFSDYAHYKARVEHFLDTEGVRHISPVSNAEGNIEEFFSWRPCDCCQRRLGGNRMECSGYVPQSQEVVRFNLCTDCVYYLEYGKLDDQTMMDLKGDEPPVQESSHDELDGSEAAMPHESPISTFTVVSSYGEITADTETGKIIKVDSNDPEWVEGIMNIDHFDMEEWHKTYPSEEIGGTSLDILDLGGWDKQGNHFSHEPDFREDLRKEREAK